MICNFYPALGPALAARSLMAKLLRSKRMDEQDRRRQQRMNEELAEAKRDRAQRALDRAWQRMRDFDEEERRLHRELDPFNWGHWN
jgi:hypothetical protein